MRADAANEPLGAIARLEAELCEAQGADIRDDLSEILPIRMSTELFWQHRIHNTKVKSCI